MSELPEDMQETLTNLDTALTALEQELEPLFETPWDVLTARLDPLEKAKLNLMMAYSTASLFFMYLKTQGISTEGHPVHLELSRIRDYMTKLKEVTSNKEQDQARLRLNKEAAERFIKGNLSRQSKKKGDRNQDDENEEEAEEEDMSEQKKKDSAAIQAEARPSPAKKANKKKS